MDREIAVRHLETARLMGVDFLPAGQASSVVTCNEGGDAATQLSALSARHDATCPHCTTAIGYTQTVFGCGNGEALQDTNMKISYFPVKKKKKTRNFKLGFCGSHDAELHVVVARVAVLAVR